MNLIIDNPNDANVEAPCQLPCANVMKENVKRAEVKKRFLNRIRFSR